MPDLYSSYINDIIQALLGRGTEIPNNSDLDNYTTPGNYYVLNNANAGTISNKPIGGSGFKLIVRNINAANRPRQEFYKPNTPEIFYVRSMTSDNIWSAWYQFTGTAVET